MDTDRYFGKPLSSAEFMDHLFGDLPELFRDEHELRNIWSRLDAPKALLESLAEKVYWRAQMAELQQIVDAETGDLFDVLASSTGPSNRRTDTDLSVARGACLSWNNQRSRQSRER